MATGAPGSNGVWQYGEDDSEATFSALLNKVASTTNTQIGADRTRLTALEATGSIVQVVTGTTGTQVNITSTSKQTTGLTGTITPKFSTSKILVIATSTNFQGAGNRGDYAIFRNNTELTIGCSSNTTGVHNEALSGADYPGGTTAITYSLRASIPAGTLETNWSGFPGSIILMEIKA